MEAKLARLLLTRSSSSSATKHLASVYAALAQHEQHKSTSWIACLSPASASTLMATLYRLEVQPLTLAKPRSFAGLSAMPSLKLTSTNKHQQCPPSIQMEKFIRVNLNEIERQLNAFKNKPAPLGRSPKPVVVAADIRHCARMFSVLLRGLCESHVAPLLPTIATKSSPSDRVRSWNRLDRYLFPHLSGSRPGFTIPLLARFEEIALKHLDLLVWTPADEDSSSSASTHSSSTSSYPHASPVRNVLSLVSLFQLLRPTHAPYHLQNALLELTSRPSSWLADLRARQLSSKPHPQGFVVAMQHDRRKQAFIPPPQSTLHTTIPGPAAETAAAEAVETSEPYQPTLFDEAEDGSDVTPAAAAPASTATAQVDEHPADSVGGSLTASSHFGSVDDDLEEVDGYATMWSDLSAADVLLLVECWASNNLAAKTFHRYLRQWLAESAQSAHSQLTLLQLQRFLACAEVMDWMNPFTVSLLDAAATRFAPSAAELELAPLGSRHFGLEIPCDRFQSSQLDAKQEQIAWKLEAEKMKSNAAMSGHNQPLSKADADAPESASAAAASSAVSSSFSPFLAHALLQLVVSHSRIAIVAEDVYAQPLLVPQVYLPPPTPGAAAVDLDAASPHLRILRALCDYYMCMLHADESGDSSMMRRHASASRALIVEPSRRLARLARLARSRPSHEQHRKDARCIITELTSLAWSIIVRQADQYAFAIQFMRTYIRWIENNLQPLQIRLEPKESVQMFQIALSLATRSQATQPLLQHLMPTSAAASSSPPPPPPSSSSPSSCPAVQFSSSMLSLLRSASLASTSNTTVSQLQSAVFAVLSDRLHMERHDLYSQKGGRRNVSQPAMLLSAAEGKRLFDTEHKFSESAVREATDALGSLLPANTDPKADPDHAAAALGPSASLAFHHHAHLFVEHTSALGYTMDAAIFMRTSVEDTDIDPAARPLSDEAVTPPLADSTASSSSSASSSPSSSRVVPFAYGRPLTLSLELDGPDHFGSSSGRYLTVTTRLRRRHLRAAGWRIVAVPYWQWNDNKDKANLETWIRSLVPEASSQGRRWRNILTKHLEQRKD